MARSYGRVGEFEGPLPKTGDRPDPERQERDCSRCGKRFKPTLRRRMLCGFCFVNA